HNPSLQVLARAGQLRLIGGVSDAALELVRDYRQRLWQVLGTRADIQPDLAGAGVEVGEGEHRIRQPPPLAYLLEEPRGGGAAKDAFQHPQGKAALIVTGHPGAAEAHVILLG